MSKYGQYHQLPFKVYSFCVYLNFSYSCIMFLVLFLQTWSVSSVGVSYSPCDDGKQFDTITCSSKDKLILTLKNHFYQGDCSNYPFYVDPEAHSIIGRETSIIATLVDTADVIYFFEKDKVIINDGRRRTEKPIGKVFDNFVGPIIHAVTIPNPFYGDRKIPIPHLITLYTAERIFYYSGRRIYQGSPFWTELDFLNQDVKFASVNKTLPPVTRIIGVTRNIVKALVLDSDKKEIFFATDLLSVCGSFTYRFNLIECLEENSNLPAEPIRGQLVKCNSTNFSGPNLLSLMLWGSLFLVILAILGLIKCALFWVFKKYLRTRHKVVRFRDDVDKGDPKKSHIILGYGIEHPSRIQTFGFDSVGQSAVSINEEYKDINYSSDVAEDEITMKENDSKPPLESIQSSNVI